MINKNIIILFVAAFITIVVILGFVFEDFTKAAYRKVKVWTGIEQENIEVLTSQATFDILEPAQKRNRYVLITGIELKSIENTLIALVNLSDETINFFPYNLQVEYNGEKRIIGKMKNKEIWDYFKKNKIYVAEVLNLNEEILVERIKNKNDGQLFKLDKDNNEKVTITTPVAFKLYFTDKINSFTIIENLYYSLLLNYVIPYDKQFEEFKEKEFKPLYWQKDILSLSEKNDLFYQQRVADSGLDFPYYLVDVRDQYLTLLRLDKVTPYLKGIYEKE